MSNELIYDCIDLPVAERRMLIEILRDSIKVEPTQTLCKRRSALKRLVCETFGYNRIRDDRNRESVLMRSFVAYQLRKERYKNKEIAVALGRDASSISAMCKNVEYMLRHGTMYEYEGSRWDAFQQKIKDYDNRTI